MAQLPLFDPVQASRYAGEQLLDEEEHSHRSAISEHQEDDILAISHSFQSSSQFTAKNLLEVGSQPRLYLATKETVDETKGRERPPSKAVEYRNKEAFKELKESTSDMYVFFGNKNGTFKRTHDVDQRRPLSTHSSHYMPDAGFRSVSSKPYAPIGAPEVLSNIVFRESSVPKRKSSMSRNKANGADILSVVPPGQRSEAQNSNLNPSEEPGRGGGLNTARPSTSPAPPSRNSATSPSPSEQSGVSFSSNVHVGNGRPASSHVNVVRRLAERLDAMTPKLSFDDDSNSDSESSNNNPFSSFARSNSIYPRSSSPLGSNSSSSNPNNNSAFFGGQPSASIIGNNRSSASPSDMGMNKASSIFSGAVSASNPSSSSVQSKRRSIGSAPAAGKRTSASSPGPVSPSPTPVPPNQRPQSVLSASGAQQQQQQQRPTSSPSGHGGKKKGVITKFPGKELVSSNSRLEMAKRGETFVKDVAREVVLKDLLPDLRARRPSRKLGSIVSQFLSIARVQAAASDPNIVPRPGVLKSALSPQTLSVNNNVPASIPFMPSDQQPVVSAAAAAAAASGVPVAAAGASSETLSRLRGVLHKARFGDIVRATLAQARLQSQEGGSKSPPKQAASALSSRAEVEISPAVAASKAIESALEAVTQAVKDGGPASARSNSKSSRSRQQQAADDAVIHAARTLDPFSNSFASLDKIIDLINRRVPPAKSRAEFYADVEKLQPSDLAMLMMEKPKSGSRAASRSESRQGQGKKSAAMGYNSDDGMGPPPDITVGSSSDEEGGGGSFLTGIPKSSISRPSSGALSRRSQASVSVSEWGNDSGSNMPARFGAEAMIPDFPEKPVDGRSYDIEFWQNRFDHVALQGQQQLARSLDSRRKSREYVYKSSKFLTKIADQAMGNAEKWSWFRLQNVLKDPSSDLWSIAKESLIDAQQRIEEAVTLYKKLLMYLDFIQAPTGQKQVELVAQIKKLLVEGRPVDQRLFFDVVRFAGSESLKQKETVKIIHFLRIVLQVDTMQFFKFMEAQKWKLTKEMREVERVIVEERGSNNRSSSPVSVMPSSSNFFSSPSNVHLSSSSGRPSSPLLSNGNNQNAMDKTTLLLDRPMSPEKRDNILQRIGSFSSYYYDNSESKLGSNSPPRSKKPKQPQSQIQVQPKPVSISPAGPSSSSLIRDPTALLSQRKS